MSMKGWLALVWYYTLSQRRHRGWWLCDWGLSEIPWFWQDRFGVMEIILYKASIFFYAFAIPLPKPVLNSYEIVKKSKMNSASNSYFIQTFLEILGLHLLQSLCPLFTTRTIAVCYSATTGKCRLSIWIKFVNKNCPKFVGIKCRCYLMIIKKKIIIIKAYNYFLETCLKCK